MHASVWVYAPQCRCPQSQDCWFLWYWSYRQLWDKGTRNQTQVFCNNNIYSVTEPFLHLPHWIFFITVIFCFIMYISRFSLIRYRRTLMWLYRKYNLVFLMMRYSIYLETKISILFFVFCFLRKRQIPLLKINSIH